MSGSALDTVLERIERFGPLPFDARRALDRSHHEYCWPTRNQVREPVSDIIAGMPARVWSSGRSPNRRTPGRDRPPSLRTVCTNSTPVFCNADAAALKVDDVTHAKTARHPLFTNRSAVAAPAAELSLVDLGRADPPRFRVYLDGRRRWSDQEGKRRKDDLRCNEDTASTPVDLRLQRNVRRGKQVGGQDSRSVGER